MQANTSHEQKTTPKQDKLIAALLAGHTIVTAAQIAKCNEATAHAWLKLPQVQAAYNSAKAALFKDTIEGLMLDASKARRTLNAIMDNAEAPHSVRVRAAQIILEQSVEIHKQRVTDSVQEKDPDLEERQLLHAMTQAELDQLSALREKVTARIKASSSSNGT